MPVKCWLPAVLALCVSLGPASSHARGAGRRRPGGSFAEGSFRFGNGARSSLQALWQSSNTARAEGVACLGGYRHEGITYITRVVQVTALWADSLYASAAASLRQCGPPEWLGTVHTHIAQYDGRPYVTFSAADRRVMAEWHKLWQADGVFCVAYDDRRAYCEAGEDSSGEVYYAYARGNKLVD